MSIEFSRFTDTLQLLKLFYYYKSSSSCIISKVLLIKYVNGVPWYNDITSYKNMSIIHLMLYARGSSVRGGVESTHIVDTSLINHTIKLEIHTLNKANEMPSIVPDDRFKELLFVEFLKLL